MNNAYRPSSDPLDDYERAARYSDFLAPVSFVRDKIKSVSDDSEFRAKDSLYQAITTVVDQAQMTAVEIECVFELDRRIDLGRAQGQSHLALAIAQRKLAGFAHATDLIDEHHTVRRLRQW